MISIPLTLTLGIIPFVTLKTKHVLFFIVIMMIVLTFIFSQKHQWPNQNLHLFLQKPSNQSEIHLETKIKMIKLIVDCQFIYQMLRRIIPSCLLWKKMAKIQWIWILNVRSNQKIQLEILINNMMTIFQNKIFLRNVLSKWIRNSLKKQNSLITT